MAAKTTDIRVHDDEQLKDQLLQLKKEQFNLRFQQATGQLEGTARIGSVRREIARIKTVLNERRTAASAQ